MTATTTPGSPVVVFHAALASMSASPGWSNPHCSGSPGSFGVSEAVMTWSGSAYSTPGSRSSALDGLRDREVGVDELEAGHQAEVELGTADDGGARPGLGGDGGAGAETDDDAARGGRSRRVRVRRPDPRLPRCPVDRRQRLDALLGVRAECRRGRQHREDEADHDRPRQRAPCCHPILPRRPPRGHGGQRYRLPLLDQLRDADAAEDEGDPQQVERPERLAQDEPAGHAARPPGSRGSRSPTPASRASG